MAAAAAERAIAPVRTLADPAPMLALLSTPPEARAARALRDALQLTAQSTPLKPWPDGIAAVVAQTIAVVRAGKTPPTAPRLPRGSAASHQVASAILSAARATGVSPGYLWRTARRESDFDPMAASARSSARGLFQFIEGTWLDLLARHGRGLGLAAIDPGSPRSRALALAWRHDPRLSARLAAELARENQAALLQVLGRPPRDHELYAAHLLGPRGAVLLIEAAHSRPDLSAAVLLPRAAAANPTVFYQRGRALTCAGLLETLRHV